MPKKTHEPEYIVVISQERGADTALVYTRTRKMKNRMEGYDVEPTEEDDDGGMTYEVPANWIRVQRPRQAAEMDEEQLEAARERLAAAREKRMTERAKTAKPVDKKSLSTKAKAARNGADEDEEEEEDVEEVRPTKSKATKAAPAKLAKQERQAATARLSALAARSNEADDEDEDEEEDDEEEVVEVVRRRPAAKEKPVAAKGSKKDR